MWPSSRRNNFVIFRVVSEVFCHCKVARRKKLGVNFFPAFLQVFTGKNVLFSFAKSQEIFHLLSSVCLDSSLNKQNYLSFYNKILMGGEVQKIWGWLTKVDFCRLGGAEDKNYHFLRTYFMERP